MFIHLQNLPVQPKHKVHVFARLVAGLVFVMTLSLSVFAATAPTPVSHDQLIAYKDLQQSRLEALKDAQQKDAEIWKARAEALDKRIDDQVSQISLSVDQFGTSLNVLSIIFAILIPLAGFFSYKNARSDAEKTAREQAEKTAQNWINANESELKEKIKKLENLAKEKFDVVKDHSEIEGRAVFFIQEKLGYTPDYLINEISRIADLEHPTYKNLNDTAHAIFDHLRMKARKAFADGQHADAFDYWTELKDKLQGRQLHVDQYYEIWSSLAISAKVCQRYDYYYPSSISTTSPRVEHRCLQAHDTADLLTQKGKLTDALNAYKSVGLILISPHTDAFVRKVILSATVSACVLRVLIAKRKVPNDSHFLYLYNEALEALRDGGELGATLSNGIALGLRAYVHFLLGNQNDATRDLNKAFSSEKNGGKDVRDCLEHLLYVHPISEDQGMRELVARF